MSETIVDFLDDQPGYRITVDGETTTIESKKMKRIELLPSQVEDAAGVADWEGRLSLGMAPVEDGMREVRQTYSVYAAVAEGPRFDVAFFCSEFGHIVSVERTYLWDALDAAREVEA